MDPSGHRLAVATATLLHGDGDGEAGGEGEGEEGTILGTVQLYSVGGLDEEPFMNLRAVGELRPPLTEDEPGRGTILQPRMLQFCRHFARGALLSVCWSEVDVTNCSTGRDIIMCYPLYFEKSVR